MKKSSGLAVLLMPLLSSCGSPIDPRNNVYDACNPLPERLVDSLLTEIEGLRELGNSQYFTLQIETNACLSGAGISNPSQNPAGAVLCASCMGAAVDYVFR